MNWAKKVRLSLYLLVFLAICVWANYNGRQRLVREEVQLDKYLEALIRATEEGDVQLQKQIKELGADMDRLINDLDEVIEKGGAR